MYTQLPQGTKNSITRSIKSAFEGYMKSIEWQEERFDSIQLMKEWQATFLNNASWYENIDNHVKSDANFHEQLAAKVNEVIGKLLEEAPSDEQLELVAKKHGKKIAKEMSCKLEAKYYIEQ